MENKVENSVGNVVRHVIVDVLLVTTVAGVAAMCTNFNKVCNGASTMCYSISCTSDEFRRILGNLNTEFRPISRSVYDILDRVHDMLDPNNTESKEGSISYKIKEILDRTNKLLDPNDTESKEGSIGDFTKKLLGNANLLVDRLNDACDELGIKKDAEKDAEKVAEMESTFERLKRCIRLAESYARKLESGELHAGTLFGK